MIALFIHLPLVTVISLLIWKRSAHVPLRSVFVPALLAKLLAGLGIGLLYTYYFPYGGDTFLFFADAKVLSNLALQAPARYIKVLLFTDFGGIEAIRPAIIMSYEPRTLFLEKIISLVNLATFDNYWLSGLYFSLFSFWGMWLLANTLAWFFPASKWAAALGCLFFPSVVLWSAGVMKESLVMGAIGVISALLLPYCFASRPENTPRALHMHWIKLLVLFLMLVMLWKLKYYYFVTFVSCFTAYFIVRWLATRWQVHSQSRQLAMLLLVFVAMMGMGSRMHPNLKFSRFLHVLVSNHDFVYAISSPHSRIEYHQLEPTAYSLVENVPEALFSGLYRPLEWTWLGGQFDNPLQLLLGLENLFLLGMTLLFLYRWIKGKGILQSNPDWLLLTSLVLYIVLLATLLAFSMPNFGTLSRYKVAFMPFMVYLLASGTGIDQCVHWLIKGMISR